MSSFEPYVLPFLASRIGPYGRDCALGARWLVDFELGGAWILIGVEFVSNFWLAHVCTHPHASTRLNRGAWREQK